MSWPPRVSGSDGELVGAVVVAVDTSVAARDVATGWLWVAVGCLGLLVLAAAGRSRAHAGGCCARSTGWSAPSPR